eukprot:8395368-Prorocentrum_lima.AAC.1
MVPKPGKDTTFPGTYRPLQVPSHFNKLYLATVEDTLGHDLRQMIPGHQHGGLPQRSARMATL